MMNSMTCRPEIDYPCRWQLRVIGQDREAMRLAVGALVEAEDFLLADGNVSTGGRYVSLHLELTISTDAERLRLYERLAAHPAIRMVL